MRCSGLRLVFTFYRLSIMPEYSKLPIQCPFRGGGGSNGEGEKLMEGEGVNEHDLDLQFFSIYFEILCYNIEKYFLFPNIYIMYLFL